MGHRDSSAALGRQGAVWASRGGTGAPAAHPRQQQTERVSRAAHVVLFAIRVYQSFFSALMPSACKFYPSCSHYAAEAVRVRGARRGSWLALRRVLRCHPFSRGGVDLVPDPADFASPEKTVYCDASVVLDSHDASSARSSSTGFSLGRAGCVGKKNQQAEAADPDSVGARDSERRAHRHAKEVRS
jgi:uncharacterized protein